MKYPFQKSIKEISLCKAK